MNDTWPLAAVFGATQDHGKFAGHLVLVNICRNVTWIISYLRNAGKAAAETKRAG